MGVLMLLKRFEAICVDEINVLKEEVKSGGDYQSIKNRIHIIEEIDELRMDLNRMGQKLDS